MLYLLFLLFGNLFSNMSVDSYLGASGSYINSRGLNLITEGFNQTYGTTFGQPNYYFGVVAGLKLAYNGFSAGAEFGYQTKSLSSESSSYAFAEKISYDNISGAITFEYKVYQYGRFSIGPVLKLGASLNLLELKAEPMPVDAEPEKMLAFNYYGDLGVSAYYDFMEGFSVFLQIAGRYSTSPAFKYRQSSDKDGETVTLSTGQDVTINTSGAYVVLGICLNIWR